MPLNNRLWLKERFAVLRNVSVESERLRGIEEIVDWTNPGPGGFYDDLGKLDCQPHLVVGPGFAKDPAFLESSHAGFAGFGPMRNSWKDHAESLLESPLRMRYDGLDPDGRVYDARGVRRRRRSTRKFAAWPTRRLKCIR